MKAFTYLVCTKCGWVHFALSRAECEAEIARYNAWHAAQPDEVRAHCSGPSSMALYDRCELCRGSYKNFRPAMNDEVPHGSTIGPLLYEDT